MTLPPGQGARGLSTTRENWAVVSVVTATRNHEIIELAYGGWRLMEAASVRACP